MKRGKVPYDINIRTISAFREMGKGHVDIETFCGYINMPPPMNKTTYQDSINPLRTIGLIRPKNIFLLKMDKYGLKSYSFYFFLNIS